MSAFNRRICLALMATTLLQPVLARRAGAAPDGEAQRMQGGGINYAPRPAVYSVLSVDTDARTVQLRAADGRTGVVHVAEDVYDLSKVKPGDKIRVDFVVPDSKSSNLRAASVWPAE